MHKFLIQKSVLSLSIITLVGVGTMLANRRWEIAVPINSESVSSPYSLAQGNSNLEVEVVTLNATGFNPARITRSKGPFLLVIENRSGFNEVNFQFDKEVGANLKTARVPRKKSSWSGVVDLLPGSYKMTEQTRPDWAMTLTLTPPRN